MSTFTSARERPPAVSIGMPVYNSAQWIAPAIESILTQSWTDLELVISDNASTDATFAICAGLAAQDARIRLHRNPRNIGANRNYLSVLRQARGEYFKWASSNDVCAPTFIEKCVRALERDGKAVLAFTQTALFESSIADASPYDRDLVLDAEKGSERLMQLSQRMGLNNAFNGVIRRSALMKAAPLGNFQRADIALMVELALMGKFTVIPETLFFRRMAPEAATKLKSAREVDQHIEPRAGRPLKWQTWLFYSAMLRAVVRQRPLSADSIAALAYVVKRIRWARGHLARDFIQAWSRGGW